MGEGLGDGLWDGPVDGLPDGPGVGLGALADAGGPDEPEGVVTLDALTAGAEAVWELVPQPTQANTAHASKHATRQRIFTLRPLRIEPAGDTTD